MSNHCSEGDDASEDSPFLCSICYETYSPPLYLCTTCSCNFHQACINKWIQTSGDQAKCPNCNAQPIVIVSNRDLDAVLQPEHRYRCRFCKASVTSQQFLEHHYAICAAYQRYLVKVTARRAEFVLELLSKNAAQAAIEFSFPASKTCLRADLNVPDRRERPQELNFVLLVRRGKKDTAEYLFELMEAESSPRYPLRLAVVLAYDTDKLSSVFKTLIRRKQTKLFQLHAEKGDFRMWICAF